MANQKYALTNILGQELIDLERTTGQDPETGQNITTNTSYVTKYTNRIFGAPYQFLDSVDRRFPSVNKHLGNEYLRNMILKGPILHIKPGVPKYTGGTDGTSIFNGIKEIYFNTSADDGMTFTESLLSTLAKSTIFGKGSKLQKRMFGFREQFNQYMSYANYMCRSMAIFLQLTSGDNSFPPGCFTQTGGKLQPFETMKWENYRMLDGATPLSAFDQLKKMGGATVLGATLASGVDVAQHLAGSAYDVVMAVLNGEEVSPETAAEAYSEVITSGSMVEDIINAATSVGNAIGNTVNNAVSGIASTFGSDDNTLGEDIAENYSNAIDTSLTDVMCDKITSVMFMVEPVAYEESIRNTTANSAIEDTLDGISNAIGQEIAFITGSNADVGVVGGITNFLGNTLSSAAEFLTGLVEPVAGGFTTNLIHGALQSIKGQKMIYPKIFQKSESSMNYQFTIRLVSPYGDTYNYYMNIIVPLMHLIALAGPRMVTANTVSSPFLVQAFIPGMCTCQMGIISQLEITKNKSLHAVNVNGFPLEVEINLTIEELYNALSISPGNDPASFLFNETLNDYMANLAGLQPSVDTYTQQRQVMLAGLGNFFTSGEMINDFADSLLTGLENFINPMTDL